MNDTLVSVVFFNEKNRLKDTLDRFPANCDYDILIVDDASTDQSARDAAASGLPLVRHERNLGVGAAIRSGIDYALARNYAYFTVVAGSGKMLPEEIAVVLDPVRHGACDYSQGSRFLGGDRAVNMPRHRKVMTKMLNVLVLALTGRWHTDITCGYRAYTTRFLRDPRLDIHQEWLNTYEMEYYLHYKAITCGYRMLEVPVTITYPANEPHYSKIKPIVGWFHMLRPWLLLRLGIKH